MQNSFLSRILPPIQGNQRYFSIGISPTYRNQKPCRSIEEIIGHCSRMSNGGMDAYMALFSFASPEGGRTQDNAYQAKCLWVDLDVGEGADKYPSQVIAIQELLRFVTATGLKPSILVSSGRGVHVYWAFDTPIGKQDWLQVSTLFRKLCDQEGLKVDPACSCDPARVLRLPGTVNTKNGAQVRILKDTQKTYHPLDFVQQLLIKVKDKSPVITTTARKGKVSHAQYQAMVDAGMIPAGPQITTARNIIWNCPQIATMGKGAYPQWFAAMSVLKCCKDGREWAHKLSSVDPRYSHGDTDLRFQQALSNSPTLCQTFESLNAQRCMQCKFRGMVKTPVQLSRISAQTPPQQAKTQVQKQTSAYLNLSQAPEYTRVTIQHPNFAVDRRGIIHRQMEKSADGSWHMKETVICQSQLYYKYSVENWDNDRPESSHVFEVVYPTGKSRDVRFIISEDGNTQSIVKWFYNANMYATSGAFTGKLLMEFMNAYLQSVVHQQGRTLGTVNKFGWSNYTDPKTGLQSKGFVTGSGIITASGLHRVHFGKMLAPYAEQYTPAGSLEAWKYIPGMYKTLNQPLGQLGICMSFAAPFMKYALGEASSAVLSIWSHLSGQGKTQMLRAAASVWGNPYEQFIDREASTPARTRKLSLLNNLPAFMDEMTTSSEDTMYGLAYTLVGGREKDKLRSSGDSFVQTGTWSTITFVTANRSFKEAISKRAGDSNATILRVMESECKFDAYTNHPQVIAYINQCIELGKKNYGLAGPEFIYRALQYPERIAVLSEEIQHWISQYGFTTNERFLSNALALALKIGRWAVEFGLLDYDMDALEDWVINKFVPENRADTKNFSPDFADIISAYITDRQLHTLSVHGSKRKPTEPDPGSYDLHDQFIVYKPSREVYIRINQREKEVVILKGDFRAWCRERHIAMSSILQALKKMGCNPQERIRCLTNGISWLAAVRGRCLVLDAATLESLGVADVLCDDSDDKGDAQVQPGIALHEGASTHEDPPRLFPTNVIELTEPVGNMSCAVYDTDGQRL